MASFSMHLAIAKLYLKTHPEEDIEEFINGTLAPDLTNDKSATHYGRHSGWANPAKYLLSNGNDIENSFKKAYFLHLITDYLFYHKLIDIDEYLDKLGVEEWRRRHRTDFDILEDEIKKKYELEDLVKKLPDHIKKHMIDNYQVDPAKIRLIPRCVDVDKFSPRAVTQERIVRAISDNNLPFPHQIFFIQKQLIINFFYILNNISAIQTCKINYMQ